MADQRVITGWYLQIGKMINDWCGGARQRPVASDFASARRKNLTAEGAFAYSRAPRRRSQAGGCAGRARLNAGRWGGGVDGREKHANPLGARKWSTLSRRCPGHVYAAIVIVNWRPEPGVNNCRRDARCGCENTQLFRSSCSRRVAQFEPPEIPTLFSASTRQSLIEAKSIQ